MKGLLQKKKKNVKREDSDEGGRWTTWTEAVDKAGEADRQVRNIRRSRLVEGKKVKTH